MALSFDKNKSVVCFDPSRICSSGVWIGHNPVDFSFPLLLLQISITITATRVIQFLLKPFKQPKIISEIIGGILIGPSFLSRNETFYQTVFPDKGSIMLQSIAVLGMVYSLFLIAVKMDPTLVTKSGKKAVIISLCGVFLSFISILTTRYLLRKNLPENISQVPVFISIAASVSITNFPALQPILSDLNLLNSGPGQLAMSMSMINDLFGYMTMLVFGILQQGGATDPLKGVWFVVSLGTMVTIIVFLIRPAMLWIIRKTPAEGPVEQMYLITIFLGVLVVAFISDMIGATVLDGPLILGLAMPNGPPLGAAIVEKTETIIEGVLMPLVFATVGLNCQLFDGHDWMPLGPLQFIIISGYVAKLVGTLLPCLYFQIPFRNALAVGLIMNMRGQVELFTFGYWRHLQLLDGQTYEVLVICSVMATAVVSPAILTICRPMGPSVSRTIQNVRPDKELNILTCISSQENVPAIINILEASHPTQKNSICVYVLHLIEFTGRANPMLVAHEKNKGSSKLTSTDHIVNAFKNYEKYEKDSFRIQPFVTMSPSATMHTDICRLALEKEASLIIIPFHKQMTFDCELSKVDPLLRTVNPKLLAEAPCSVGILVAYGLDAKCLFLNHFSHCISILFFGGPDDREALAYGARMARKSSFSLTVMRILTLDDFSYNIWERALDEEVVNEFKHRNTNTGQVVYREKVVKDSEELFAAIRSMGNTFNLFIVGRRHERNLLLNENLMEWSENPDLGVIGDLLTSLDFRDSASVLVMQQGTEVNRYNHPL